MGLTYTSERAAQSYLPGVFVITSLSSGIIVSVAGSDSTSGAGIQADIKTAAALGGWCHTAISAITAQTPESVSAIMPVPAELVLQQLEAIFSVAESFSPGAVKTGMLGTAETIVALADFMARKRELPLVVDTVFASTSRRRFVDEEMLKHVKDSLLPLASIITPNLQEAAIILGCEMADSVEEMHQQAKALLDTGAGAVLLTGGHLPGDEAIDVLYSRDYTQEFRAKKLNTSHTHGSGCSLATGIAVGIAQGKTLQLAVQLAKQLVSESIARANTAMLVEENGPLIHF